MTDDEYGLTFIEVLIAMTVFSMGMMGLMSLQIISIRGTTLSYAATVAGTVAQAQMEKIMQADYYAAGLADINRSNNDDLDSTVNTDYQNRDADGAPIDLKGYALALNVADNAPIRNTKTVVVLVSWNNGRQTRRLSTIKSLAGESRGPLWY